MDHPKLGKALKAIHTIMFVNRLLALMTCQTSRLDDMLAHGYSEGVDEAVYKWRLANHRKNVNIAWAKEQIELYGRDDPWVQQIAGRFE